MATSTEREGLHSTEWAGKGALSQKSIENLVGSDFYPALQHPSQTHENASTEPFSAAPGACGTRVILPLPWSWLIDLCFEPNNFCEELKKNCKSSWRSGTVPAGVSWSPCGAEVAFVFCKLGLRCSSSRCWASFETFCNSFFTPTHAENDTLPGLHGELSNTFLPERHTGSNSSQIRGTSQGLHQLSSPPSTQQV